MSIIIAKKAGVQFDKDGFTFKIDYPEIQNNLNFAYSDGKKIHSYKFNKTSERVWALVERITDYPAIFFINEHDNPLYELTSLNVPPIRINSDIVYVGSGDILNMGKELGKTRTDVAYLNEWRFSEIVQSYPNFFFSDEGKWMLEKIFPNGAMAFLRNDGKISIINKDDGCEDGNCWVYDSEVVAMRTAYGNSDWGFCD